MESENQKLRFITYMFPGYPVELFQVYQHYLEEVLHMESFLIVESGQSGKSDPFTLDEVDIGFMSSTAFIKAQQEQNKYIELLPTAPIHIHSKSELKPVYFSEIVVNSDKIGKYKAFKDLKGHTWAYNDESSLSGSIITLAELKKQGANASFFGNKLESGSHQRSILLVLNNKVDAASIDSNVLELYLLDHPEYKSQIHILCTFGPLPIPPIVVNSRMSKELKDKITQALLDMDTSEKWQKELSRFKVWGFKPIDSSLYDMEREVTDIVKGLSVHTVYY